MAVHHVDMDPVGALRLDAPGISAPEGGEIGGEDRRGDLDGAVEGMARLLRARRSWRRPAALGRKLARPRRRAGRPCRLPSPAPHASLITRPAAESDEAR